jgi:hypothetical protein
VETEIHGGRDGREGRSIVSERRGLSFRFLLVSASIALGLGAAGGAAAEGPGINWLSFRGNWVAAVQSGGNSFSGELAWTPAARLNEDFSLRAVLGATVLKGRFGSNFVAMDGELLLGIRSLAPWELELGPGLQRWSGTGGGTGASGNLVLARRLTETWSAFGGYSPVFAPGNLTHELKFGAGISF